LSVKSEQAVLLCGHGSRDAEGVAEFEAFRAAAAARLAPVPVVGSYLEFAAPNIRGGLQQLYDDGARRILALPVMLFAAGHVKNDIPWELNSFAKEHGALSVDFGRELALDPKLIAAAADRIAEAEAKSARSVARADSLLLVVGRGTNDPDANGNVAKLARMLGEGMGFGWAAAGYSGVTEPNVTAALEQAAKLGFARIVVFPYFLFTGVLVKRVYAALADAASRHPGIEFIAADYLKHHPQVIEALVDRLAEIDTGGNLMNCLLCKYREQVVGYEAATGQAQEGHHHHVRGQANEHTRCHDLQGHGQHAHEHHTHGHDGHAPGAAQRTGR
jgi:sirohydrochlorin cobaltochelatase